MTKENPLTKPAGDAPKRIDLEALKKQMLANLADPEVAKAVDAEREELAERMRETATRKYRARSHAKEIPKPSGAAPKRVNLEELKKQMLENLSDPDVAERVEARQEELGDEMEKAASRAHQVKLGKPRPSGQ